MLLANPVSLAVPTSDVTLVLLDALVPLTSEVMFGNLIVVPLMNAVRLDAPRFGLGQVMLATRVSFMDDVVLAIVVLNSIRVLFANPVPLINEVVLSGFGEIVPVIFMTA